MGVHDWVSELSAVSDGVIQAWYDMLGIVAGSGAAILVACLVVKWIARAFEGSRS